MFVPATTTVKQDNAALVPHFTEHVYATKHGVELPLRVWRSTTDAIDDANYADPSDPAAYDLGGSSTDLRGLQTPHNEPGSGSCTPAPPAPKPWLLWSHGGAFMGGSVAPAPWVLPAFLPWAHVVSYGYRLAPAVGIDEMAEDGADAVAWCRANLPAILDDINIDACIVGGLSAGGSLAILNGLLTPRPRVVLDAYGIVDFADTHFDPKFTGPGYDPGSVSGRYSEGQLEHAIAGRDASTALTALPGNDDPDAQGAVTAVYSRVKEMLGWTDPQGIAADVKVHVAATGRIMRVLTRREKYPDNDTWRVAATRASPITKVDEHFPATVILHGVEDRTVPVDQSARFAKALRNVGVVVKEVYVPDADHCFDFTCTVSRPVGQQHDLS